MALGAILAYNAGKKSGGKKAKRAEQELEDVRRELDEERQKSAQLSGFLSGLQAGGGGFNNPQQGLALAQAGPAVGVQPAGFQQSIGFGAPASGFQTQGLYGSPYAGYSSGGGGITLAQSGPAGTQVLRA